MRWMRQSQSGVADTVPAKMAGRYLVLQPWYVPDCLETRASLMVAQRERESARERERETEMAAVNKSCWWCMGGIRHATCKLT